MFTLTIDTMTIKFDNYSVAIGTMFSLLGASILQKETKAFCLSLGEEPLRIVEIANGIVIFDNSIEFF